MRSMEGELLRDEYDVLVITAGSFMFLLENNVIFLEMFRYYHSVMQSDRNSFCGDVLLNSFNTVYSVENSV